MDAYYQFEVPRARALRALGNPATCKRHVLLLHGFGVGTFHYDAQLRDLADDDTCVWALDYCGQGSSWPTASSPSSTSTDAAPR